MESFFDVLKPNPAIAYLFKNGILVKSSSRYTIFRYYGKSSDLSGLACRIDQPLFPDESLVVSISTTYLLKHFFKWKT